MRGQLLILTFGLAILFHGAISSRAQTKNATTPTERHHRRKVVRTVTSSTTAPTVPIAPLLGTGRLTRNEINKLAKDMGVVAYKEFSASTSSSSEESSSTAPASRSSSAPLKSSKSSSSSSSSSLSSSSSSSSGGTSNESNFSTRKQRATAGHNRRQDLVDAAEVTSSSAEYQTFHGVMGKPGRDFPVLTHIPKTKFTCRRKKSGYYADLDTDCQVFHICDNGRKISFLCPNGTIFRQHDQICDWWFKVECQINNGDTLIPLAREFVESPQQQRTDPAKRIITEKSLVFGNHQIQNDSPGFAHVNFTNSDDLVSYEASTYQKQSYERQHSQNQFTSRQKSTINSTVHYKNSHQQTQFSPTPFQQSRDEQIFVATENPIKTTTRNVRKTVRRQKLTKTTSSTTSPSTPVNESQVLAESASFTSNSNKRFYQQQQNNLDHNSGHRRPQQYNTDFTRSNVFDGSQQQSVSRTATSTQSPNSNSRSKYTRRPNGRYSSKVRQNFTINTNSKLELKEFDEGSYRFNESFAPFTPSSVLTTTTTTKPSYGFFLTFTFPTTTTTTAAATSTTTSKPFTSALKDCGSPTHNHTSAENSKVEATTSPTSTFLTPKIDSLYSRVTKSYGDVQTTEITPHTYRDAKQLADQQTPPLNKSADDLPYYYPIPINYSDPTIYSPEDDSLPPFFTTTEKPRYSTSATKYSPTVPTVTPKPLSGRAYTPSTPLPTQDPSENAIRMLHTLDDLSGGKDLEIEEDLKYFGEPRPGLKIPPSSSPDTLHSLAAYFASQEEEPKEDVVDNNSINSALLTKMTLNNYNKLFTSDNKDDQKAENDASLEIQNKLGQEIDLNLQESQGPVDRQPNKNKNSTTVSIRKLARVFTHALSEYLKDPATFRRVLTEVRPKEPNSLPESEYNDLKAPIGPPTTTEQTTTSIFTDHPSITKEEDEVLEYSDVIKTTSRARYYSPTVPTTESTTTTEVPVTSPTTVSLLNSLALQLNNEINSINSNKYEASSAENTSSSLDDDYFPLNYFERNDTTPTPYGLHVKPNNSSPLGLNDLLTTTDLPATTTATHIKTYFIPEDLNKLAIVRVNEKPFDHLKKNINQITNEEKLQVAFSQSFVKDRSSKQNNEFKIIVTTEPPTSTTENSFTESTTTNRPTTTTEIITTTTAEVPSTTTTTIDYSTTTQASQTTETQTSSTTESLTSTQVSVPSTTLVPPYRDDDRVGRRRIPPNHWTNSLEISRFLQASVTLDPEIINQELTGDNSGTSTTSAEQSTTVTSTHIYETSTNVNDATTQTTTATSHETFNLAETSKAVSPPSRTGKSYSDIQNVTTSTNNQIDDIKITSQQIIYNLPLIPEDIQMQSAKMIFGDLNTTSQDIIMEKMKHADKNKSVRKLVLLLINTCDLNHNRTLEHARKAILNALINIPLEDDEVVIDNPQNNHENDDLNSSSSGRNIPSPSQTSTTTTTELPLLGTTTNKYQDVTTYRNVEFISRHNRKLDHEYQSETTEHNFSIDLLPEFENNSDKRALELLKSLYSLASRWSRK